MITLIPLVGLLVSGLTVSGLSEGDPGNSNQHRTGYACEGSTLTLTCEDSYHINLIRANFGRFSISTCNTQGNLEWSVNCKSPESFALIQRNCNRKQWCPLAASSASFGDPCPGTYKYLEVHYECVPKNSRPGSSEVRSMVDDIWSGSQSSSASSLSSSPSFSLPSSQSQQSSEQSFKPKIISPPPIIKPNIAPRTSSTTVSPSPSDVYVNNNDTIYVPHPYPTIFLKRRKLNSLYLAIHPRDVKDILDYPGKLILPLPSNSDDSETSLDHASVSQYNGNSVELSKEAIFDLGLTNGFTRLFVVMFERLDSILEPEYYKPPSEEGGFKILNSDIIGITLNLVGSNASRVSYSSLRTGSVWIKITFRHLLVQNVTNPKCVYWDPDRLDWSAKGSYLLLSNFTHTFCEYDHLGYFGLIMDQIDSPIETPTVPSGDLYLGNFENEGTIRILLILGSTLNSIILLIALVTLFLVRSLQTKESSLIHKNVTINLLLDHLVLLLILGTYFSPSYFNSNSLSLITSTSHSSNYLYSNTPTLRSFGLLVALYHYFLLIHFVWILFDLVELHFRLSRKQFVDQSTLVLGPSGSVAATVNASSAVSTASVLAGTINPVKLSCYLYVTSYSVPLIVILLISWSTSSQALPMFANLCSLEARSHLASFVIASSIILTGLGLVLLLVTYSRIGLQATAAAAAAAAASSAASPSVPVGSFVYPPGLMTSADKFALDLMLNRKLKISLFLRFSLNLLAAINCALGVVYLTYKVSTIGYLFALTNVSLGLFVFSYYCLTKENIRSRYSLICSYAARYVICFKGDSKTDYLNNHGNPHLHHHPGHHANVIHHLPLNSGLNDGLSRGIVVGAYNKNPSIPNLTGNPAQLTEPIIGNSTSMGALSSMARDYSSSKHYLASDGANTESGSDYGCRRLTAAAAAAAATNQSHLVTHGPTPNHFYHLYNPKQPCNPYSCHHMIEHVYECIDDEPYVAKVILPAGSAVASTTLGNYRLHSMAAAAAAAHHGHHLHHLHFQQTLPNHYLGYHNLKSLHNSGSHFDVARSAVNPGSSTNFQNDRNISMGINTGMQGGTLQRCLVSTSLSAKNVESPSQVPMSATTITSQIAQEHNLTPL